MAVTNPTGAPPVQLALDLAAHGWHVFPLSPSNKRPLANCLDCQDNPHCADDDYDACACLPDGQWCHGVRAATTDPDRITTWWRRTPHAVPAIAAGPSGLVLIDLDTHSGQPPADPATQLLPGIPLADDQVPGGLGSIRNGIDAMHLLARVRGGPRPWPSGPKHQPVSVHTPSGGRHLWYRAPDNDLHQALSALGWQIDIKAGWSYGIAPGATTASGTYTIHGGAPHTPGRMPDWLLEEVRRVAGPKPAPAPPTVIPATPGQGNAVGYVRTVLDRGTAEIAPLTDGRKAALSALAYKVGGLLTWAGLTPTDVEDHLVHAGLASGLHHRDAHRIVHRSLTNGLNRPLPAPSDRRTA
ncbi:bifunctional DNA primase/polymerase [Actinomadura oligospora]|uniref:bifunctional DNA primase/polymerase n=1 Tax=Actinomadura oligospora TaxID=111804 RepID=UPI0004B131E0|nr:bifunctional DNA primase/polymerase [Actinomadura oligospora]